VSVPEITYKPQSYGGLLAKTSVLLAGITLLIAISGFFKEIATATAYGASAELDAYLVALTLPVFLWGIYGDLITGSFIPVRADLLAHHPDETEGFVDSIFSGTILFFVASIAAVFLIQEIVLGALAPGFSRSGTLLTGGLLALVLPATLFLGLAEFERNLLNAVGVFIAPAFSYVIPSALTIVAIIALAPRWGIFAAAGGYLLGSILQVVFLSIWLLKRDLLPRIRIRFWHPYTVKLLALGMPLVLGGILTSLYPFVDRAMASFLPSGSIAALGYADKLTNQVRLIFAYSLVTVVFPHFAHLASRQENHLVAERLRAMMRWGVLLLLPCVLLLATANQQIIEFLFQRGAFGMRDTALTASALFGYSLGILFSTSGILVQRAFLAFQDAWIPFLSSLVFICGKVIFNILLIPIFGHTGIAISTSLSYLCSFVLLVAALRRLGFHFRWINQARWIGKMLVASAIMVIIVNVLEYLFSLQAASPLNNLVFLGFASLCGITSFYLVGLALGIVEIREAVGSVMTRLRLSVRFVKEGVSGQAR